VYLYAEGAKILPPDALREPDAVNGGIPLAELGPRTKERNST
jgi:hypothetical protein